MSANKQFSSSVEKKIESDIAETKQLVSEEERQLVRIKQLDVKIEVINNSTQTLIPSLAPLHNYCRSKWRWYYNWHLNKSASAIHQIILCLYIAGLAGFLVK